MRAARQGIRPVPEVRWPPHGGPGSPRIRRQVGRGRSRCRSRDRRVRGVPDLGGPFGWVLPDGLVPGRTLPRRPPGAGRSRRPRGLLITARPRLVALLALVAFTAWSFLSIAGPTRPATPGRPPTGARCTASSSHSLPAGGGCARAALGLLASFSIGVCAIGLAAIAGAARSSDPGASFVDGRFAEPIGYPNGNAALFLVGFWPALVIGSRREVPALARAALLAVAAALAELALLSQSRGAAVAFAVTAVLAAVVLPGRLRLLVATIPVAAAVAVAAPGPPRRRLGCRPGGGVAARGDRARPLERRRPRRGARARVRGSPCPCPAATPPLGRACDAGRGRRGRAGDRAAHSATR